MFELVFVWMLWAGVIAAVAAHRNRSPVGWFLFCLFLSPVIGTIAVLSLPPRLEPSQARLVDVPTDMTHTRCPACREVVRRDATKCKHCQSELKPTA